MKQPPKLPITAKKEPKVPRYPLTFDNPDEPEQEAKQEAKQEGKKEAKKEDGKANKKGAKAKEEANDGKKENDLLPPPPPRQIRHDSPSKILERSMSKTQGGVPLSPLMIGQKKSLGVRREDDGPYVSYIEEALKSSGVCSTCGGMRFIIYEVPLDHPYFSKTFPCPHCNANNRDFTQIIARASRLDAYQTRTFESFTTVANHLNAFESRELEIALEVATSYVRNPMGWLIFHGSCGTGKTHLAAAIGHRLIEMGKPVIFTTVPDLLDHLRRGYAPNNLDMSYDKEFDQLCEVDYLILDDLGAENPTAWAQEKLYQLINHRYAKSLGTIVTTNVDFQLMDERIASRLMDTQLVMQVQLDVPDFRRDRNLENPIIKGLGGLAQYREKTLERFILHTHPQKDLFIHVNRGIQFVINEEGWLIIKGGYGTGKTHLAAGLAHHWANIKGRDLIFSSLIDIMDFLREPFNQNSAYILSTQRRFDMLRTTPLLIIDDFNLTARTPTWTRDKLFQLLDYRYLRKLPTILTLTDPRLQEIRTHHGDIFSRMTDARLTFWVDLGEYDRRYAGDTDIEPEPGAPILGQTDVDSYYDEPPY